MQKSLSTLLENIIDIPSEIKVAGITNDSRCVKTGYLFLACVGESTDARRYIPDVLGKAAAVLYQADDTFELTQRYPIPCIAVPELNRWQGEIASRFYDAPSKSMCCIGVTGTNGKTTCTHMIAQTLKQCSVIGTLGAGFLSELQPASHTTPDPIALQKTLSRLKKEGSKAVAMEVSSHALVQHRVNGVHFDTAVFTQLSRDHLDYHGDMSAYARAKAQLFEKDSLRYVVINQDDVLGTQLIKQCAPRYEVVSYSLQGSATASIRVKKMTPTTKGFTIEVSTPWGEGCFTTSLMGQFNISNCLATLGVLGLYGVPFDVMCTSMSELRPVSGRMECFASSGQPTVVVDYSHTPDALEKALLALRDHCEGQLWCVFGCGGDRDRGKRPEMAKVAEQYSDRIIVTQDNPRSESPEQIVDDIMTGFSRRQDIEVLLDRADAIAYAVLQAKQRDVVLIAGKGHEREQIIGECVIPFNDAEQVKKTLARRRQAK